MRKPLLLCLLVLTAACKSKKIDRSPDGKYQIEKLAESISNGTLEKEYSNAMIAVGVDHFEEGTIERPYSILYPETENEILVIWKDDNKRDIHQIYYDKEGRWSSEQGIRIGTTYEELEDINGAFKVYGFGWDYSGAVDWDGGKMADSNIQVFLAPGKVPAQKFYGDHVLELEPHEIRDLQLKVKAINYQKLPNE